MSKVSDNPLKYWRGSVALPAHRKKEFDKRMDALGLKTIGQLATMFSTTPGVVEALAPVVREFHKSRDATVHGVRAAEVARQLKGMSPERLAKIMELVQQSEEASS